MKRIELGPLRKRQANKDTTLHTATVPLLICIPGALVGGMLCEKLGPRRLLLLLSPLLCSAFVLMKAATWKIVLQAGLAEVLLLSCRVVQVSH